MGQLRYTREFVRSIKEALETSHLWSAYYLKVEKAVSIVLQKVLLFAGNHTPASDEKKLWLLANSCDRAVRQRTVCQETTMTKTRTLPSYLYSTKIIELSEITKACLGEMLRLSAM